MAVEFDLIPPGTRVESNGDAANADVSGSRSRTFLCRLLISDQVEQESIDVSIWGSADGENWGQKPILKLPQQFYRGETRMVLDLALQPEVKFIRARWELNRWGRVAPLPTFEIGLHVSEVAAMPQRTPSATTAGT